MQALLGEIGVRKDYLGHEEVGSVYFGGGTPSLLSADEIGRIFDSLASTFTIVPEAEITLEANPDDVTREWLDALKNTPVNRLSIGIQSFFDEDLFYLNRVHTSGQAKAAIELAQESGFENLTIDLIYGIPGLSMERWRNNLEMFFSYRIPHLSAYSLTVESRTALHHLIKKLKMAPPDDQETADQFRVLQKIIREKGYVHYEISNFSVPGHYSRHNSLYWLGGNYLGFGPSAHSYNGRSRQWNISNLAAYLRDSKEPGNITEVEYLTPAERYNEYIMTSLRTIWGCDTEHIQNIFGREQKNHFLEGARKYISKGWLRQEGSAYYLTDEGILFADGITSSLFAEEKA